MKQLFSILFLISSFYAFAQTGEVSGVILDKEYNNQPLPFADVYIKGTTQGASTDFDGKFTISNVPTGTKTLVITFIGYESKEIDINIVAGRTTTVNESLSAGETLEGVVVEAAPIVKETEAALLKEQKKAVVVKESIGAEEIESLGISDASTATTKISGVTKTEGSGEIYVRGLGDRYLSTTLNGLPIPSDNIDKKNIDLVLFPTRFIQNVSVGKTFSPSNSADIASGNIDIISKEVSKSKDIAASVSGGINSSVTSEGVFENFKVSPVNNDVNFGFFTREFEGRNLETGLTQQAWDPETVNPLNYSFGFNAGGILGKNRKWKVYAAAGQSVDNQYREGLFREFDQGVLRDNVPANDNRFWRRTVNTTGMFNTQYKINTNHKLSFNTFAVNKVFQEVYEAGRERTTEIFEELDNLEEGSQFVRDQNIKNTTLSVSQLLGNHKFSETNKLDWALGYSFLDASEPNRIRNELNILNESDRTQDGEIQFGFTGGFQQRKSIQEIEDVEISARLKDEWIIKQDEDEEAVHTLGFGGDFRNKTRNFRSIFFGIDDPSQNPIFIPSIDNLNSVFTTENLQNGSLVLVPQESPDTFRAELISFAGFADIKSTFGKLNTQLGLRFQSDNIAASWDVFGFISQTGVSRIGSTSLDYQQVYPYINLKYSFNDKLALRFASSLSETLPEFKEISVFPYIDALGQVYRGNPDLERSENLNADLKLEFFPERDEVLSVSVFYKQINNAINRGLQRGGEGIFSYFNTSDEARVFGIELEGRYNIFDKEKDGINLKASGNISYINHEQDLRNTIDPITGRGQNFQYDGRTKIGLEGASDWVINSALTFNSGTENPYQITLSGNYASDKIFALGAPRNQRDTDRFFNSEIIEKGFVTLNLIINKQLTEKLSIGVIANNLLNPSIERFQPNNQNASTLERSSDTILSYRNGVDSSLSIKYKF